MIIYKGFLYVKMQFTATILPTQLFSQACTQLCCFSGNAVVSRPYMCAVAKHEHSNNRPLILNVGALLGCEQCTPRLLEQLFRVQPVFLLVSVIWSTFEVPKENVCRDRKQAGCGKVVLFAVRIEFREITLSDLEDCYQWHMRLSVVRYGI